MHWSERYAADPALAAFTILPHRGARILVRRGYEQTAEVVLHGRSSGVVGWADGGREAHPVVELDDGCRMVVRRYRRGGALRRLNRERYFLGNRAFHEVLVMERAARGGVRVPRVVAAVERPARIVGYTAELATLWIDDAREIAAWLRQEPAQHAEAALRSAGGEIAKLHAAGVAHPDLNLRNLLVTSASGTNEPEVYLIDFDRGRAFPEAVPLGRRRRDLLRLRRSARKLDAPITAAGWAALREGYGTAWPLPRSLG